MSEQQEVKKLTLDNVNEEKLKNVKYHDLLETFTQLGVQGSWKPGSAKDDMIKTALSKIAILKKLKSAGIADENLPQALKAQEAKNEEKKEEKLSKEEAKSQEKEVAQEEAKGYDKYDEKQLKKFLINIDGNLKNNVPKQRPILLAKRAAVQIALDKK